MRAINYEATVRKWEENIVVLDKKLSEEAGVGESRTWRDVVMISLNCIIRISGLSTPHCELAVIVSRRPPRLTGKIKYRNLHSLKVEDKPKICQFNFYDFDEETVRAGLRWRSRHDLFVFSQYLSKNVLCFVCAVN